MLEARQARVKAHRRHHLSVLEVARRHHQLCLLGEAYDVVDLGGVPLEEEEEEACEVSAFLGIIRDV